MDKKLWHYCMTRAKDELELSIEQILKTDMLEHSRVVVDRAMEIYNQEGKYNFNKDNN
jgi:hypothetical protein